MTNTHSQYPQKSHKTNHIYLFTVQYLVKPIPYITAHLWLVRLKENTWRTLVGFASTRLITLFYTIEVVYHMGGGPLFVFQSPRELSANFPYILDTSGHRYYYFPRFLNNFFSFWAFFFCFIPVIMIWL